MDSNFKDKFLNIKPGMRNHYNPKQGWTLENEIEWTENFTHQLEKTLHYHYDRLDEMYKAKAWWVRFMRYCQTGK